MRLIPFREPTKETSLEQQQSNRFQFLRHQEHDHAEGGMLTGTPEFIAQARIAHMHGMTKDALKRYEKKEDLGNTKS